MLRRVGCRLQQMSCERLLFRDDLDRIWLQAREDADAYKAEQVVQRESQAL